jgi:hypothetical protein
MTTAAPIEQKRVARDTSTRYANVYARHELRCGKALDKTRRCSCDPSYYGKVYDPAIGSYRVTKPRVKNLLQAKGMKDDLLVLVHTGSFPEDTSQEEQTASPTFAAGHTQFIKECKEGVARTKKGKRYTKKSIWSLDSGLRRVPSPIKDRQMTLVTQGELQTMVDGFLRGPKPLSAEREAEEREAVGG